jgi:hypothetical protein
MADLTALRRARLTAVVESVIADWPIDACEAFRTMIESPEGASLLVLDGDTEIERAANGRALARYFLERWEQIAPLGVAVAVDDLLLDRRSTVSPSVSKMAQPPQSAVNVAYLARLVERLGHDVALRVWQRPTP